MSHLKVYICCLSGIIKISLCLSKLELANVGAFFDTVYLLRECNVNYRLRNGYSVDR